jgi:mannosyltransferase
VNRFDSEQEKMIFVRPVLLGLLLAAVGLRFGGLGTKDLWIDEAFTLWMAQHPLPVLWEWTVRVDHHPPLFYALSRGWRFLAGESEVALRFLPAWFGVLTVPIFYRFAMCIVAQPAALLGTVLLVFAPFHVAYAQEARMYTLLGCAVAATFFGAAVFLQERSSRVLSRAGLGLALCQAAAMWSHNTAAVFVPLALNLGVVGLWWIGHGSGRRSTLATGKVGPSKAERQNGFLLRWAAVQAVALLLWLPWAPNFWVQAQAVETRFWVQPATLDRVWLAWQTFSFGWVEGWFPWTELWIGGFGAVAVAGMWRLWRKQTVGKAVLWLLLCLMLVGPVAALLVGVRRPLFLESTLIWTTLPYYTLAGVGMAGLLRWASGWASTRWIGRLMVAGVGAVLVWAVGIGLWSHYMSEPREAWRAAVATVAAGAERDDLVLFHAAWTQLPFAYYAEEVDGAGDARHEQQWEMGGLPDDLLSLFEQGELEPEVQPEYLPRVQARVADVDRVWLIYSHAWYSDPAGMIPGTLAEEFSLVAYTALPGVDVYLYARNSNY